MNTTHEVYSYKPGFLNKTYRYKEIYTKVQMAKVSKEMKDSQSIYVTVANQFCDLLLPKLTEKNISTCSQTSQSLHIYTMYKNIISNI